MIELNWPNAQFKLNMEWREAKIEVIYAEPKIHKKNIWRLKKKKKIARSW
jgi:hypothetical protein